MGLLTVRYSTPVVVVAVLLAFVALAVFIPQKYSDIGTPALAACAVFLLFGIILSRRVGDNILGEIGFLYLGLALAYTVLPAAFFLSLGLETSSGTAWERLAVLLPESAQLGQHLWRHVLFLFGVATGYLLIRKPLASYQEAVLERPRTHPLIVWFLIGMILTSISVNTAMSAPTETYIDHYTRYDHLSRGALVLVHVFFILKTAFYYIFLVLAFRDYHRYKYIIGSWLIAVCAYETIYSYGSRILTLTIILAAICLYHYRVQRISLKKGAIGFLGIAALFSLIELLRSLEFDITQAKDAISSDGAGPAAEFGSVFFTGFHLYSERADGALPARPLPMFFNDVLSLIPFVGHVDWHPQYWYARNYFPDAVVPPETMGPIADSAIWGGEVDLVLRSLLSGAIYGWLVNWFIRNQNHWWVSVVYTYCFATSIMTLKYSILYPLVFLKLILPGVVVIWLFNHFFVRSKI